MTFKKNLILIVMIITAISCKNKLDNSPDENQEDEAVEVQEELPVDFMEFYNRFGEDSIFQLQHIVFPLDGEKALSDSGTAGIHLTKWEQKDWKIQRTFDDMGGTFQREFITFHGIVSEKIQDSRGEFSMLRRFSKIGDQWMLIFYQEMGKH